MKKSVNTLFPKGILFVGIVILLSFGSCITSEDTGGDEVSTFTYTMTTKKNMEVSLRDMQDAPVSGVVVDVYYEYPYNEVGQLMPSVSSVSRLVTDDNGYLSSVIDIPSYLTEFYLVTNYPGYANPDTVALTADNLSLMIHPAGYGSDAAASPLRVGMALRATSDTPYKLSGFTNVWSLGTFNSNGLPHYLLNPEGITNELKLKINTTFPENERLPLTNPSYFLDPSKSNIELVDSCEIWAAFITEGANWTNSIGYFYYPTNTPPTNVNQILKHIIMFQNVSLAGSGGAMSEGAKVKLKYFDETSNTWSEIFPPNITVGWFLIANGFVNKKVTNGYYWNYSIPALNDQTVEPQQCVTVYDQSEYKIIIGFEDTRRVGTASSDEDFNDVVLGIIANPITSVNTDALFPIKSSTDLDGDNVNDSEDAFPSDPDRAFQNYAPQKDSFGSLVYEDLWPSKGDYDFNDFVVDYNFITVTNAQNQVTDITATFKARAVGAFLNNAFAFQLGVPSSDVALVNSSYAFTSQVFTLNSNGTEANQTKAVIPVFDDINTIFGTRMVNTTIGGTSADPITVTMTIVFNTPVSLSELGLPPYNPFLIADVTNGRGTEVHLAGMEPTDLVNTLLFGTNQDRTDLTAKKYYQTTLNYPWALNFPVSFSYPVEKANISGTYLNFDKWVDALGASFVDWYLPLDGYRNTNQIYR